MSLKLRVPVKSQGMSFYFSNQIVNVGILLV